MVDDLTSSTSNSLKTNKRNQNIQEEGSENALTWFRS